jgi:periplasmic protein TonB
MASDDRAATLFFLLSVLLHLGLLIPLPFLQPHEMPPTEEPPRAQYVVRLPQPARAMTPISPPPMTRPQPRPEPTTVAPAQPRLPQPLERPQPRQERTQVLDTAPPPVTLVEPERADRPAARQPTPLTSQATTVRRQKLPSLPQVAPRPVPPAESEPVSRPVPRQPSTHWQEAMRPPQQAPAPGDPDPLATYLAQVRAAIERHKRYPSAALRVGMTGYVVLRFVILADGRVIDASVAESSGHAAFGGAALESLRRAGTMPPFPETIQRERLLVQVPIAFKLTE